MENEIIICPACGAKVSSNKNFCTQCGYSFDKMREAQNVLDNDPKLVELNEKYGHNRKAKKNWSIALVTSIIVVYMWLEYNWFEYYFTLIPTLAILFIPISIVALIISNTQVLIRKKKIESELKEKVGNHHLDV